MITIRDTQQARKDLTLDNPAYAARKMRRLWLGETPRTLRYYQQCEQDGMIAVPLGYASRDRLRGATGDVEYTWQGHEPRPYQTAAVTEMTRHTCGCVVATTGSGKTLIGLLAIATVRRPALIVVHRRELAAQWQQACRDMLGVEPIILHSRARKIQQPSPITIGVSASLARGPLPPHEMLLIDECHHAPAAQTIDVAQRSTAAVIYGLTATASRADGLWPVVELHAGPIRYRVSRQEAEAAGAIVPAKVIAVPGRSYPAEADWAALQARIALDAVRTRMVADMACSHDNPVVVLAERIVHAEQLHKEIATRRDVLIYHGGLPAKQRADALDAIRAGAQITVATYATLGEGVDVPGWGVAILASPLGSRGSSSLQAIGRVVRCAIGKSGAQIYEIVDDHKRARSAWRGRRKRYVADGISVDDRGVQTQDKTATRRRPVRSEMTELQRAQDLYHRGLGLSDRQALLLAGIDAHEITDEIVAECERQAGRSEYAQEVVTMHRDKAAVRARAATGYTPSVDDLLSRYAVHV